MIFADDIMAGVGGISDMGGMIQSFASKLARAERFVLDRQVIEAAKQLAKSNPKSLVSALPLCRAPYATTWFEWTDATGKAGCLVESDDEGRQGIMTFASAERLNDADKPVPIISGVSSWFDYGGDAITYAKHHWREVLPHRPDYQQVFDRWNPGFDPSIAQNKEDEAWLRLGKVYAQWLSPHAAGLMKDKNWPEELVDVWREMAREAAALCQYILMMLNSRNAVEHQDHDISRLNKARVKSDKPPLLAHRVTHLHLSRARLRDAEASGMTRTEMRAHMVRGHFKVRRTGVYWWSAFVRGRHGTLDRDRYQVHH